MKTILILAAAFILLLAGLLMGSACLASLFMGKYLTAFAYYGLSVVFLFSGVYFYNLDN